MGLFKPVVFYKQKVVAGGIPVQPEATAFLTAAGITDPTITDAVNELVYDMKNAGIYSNMIAVYPFVGGTATTHKYNLIDPADTNAAYRLTFSGVTHTSDGITNGGGNDQASFTRINITSLNQNSVSMGVYSGTAGQDRVDMAGVSSGRGIQMLVRDVNDKFSTKCMDSTSDTSVSNTDGRGFYQISRTSSTEYTKQKETTESSVTRTSQTPTTRYIAIGGIGQTETTSFLETTRNYRFAYVGGGLTDSELDDYYNAVQKFQTTLGRNV